MDLRLAEMAIATSAAAHSLASLAARQDPNRRQGRIALVASDDATFGIARTYVAYREKTGITLEVFRQMKDAEDWLATTRAGTR